jgi:hypothetical protein
VNRLSLEALLRFAYAQERVAYQERERAQRRLEAARIERAKLQDALREGRYDDYAPRGTIPTHRNTEFLPPT